jgi:hypothetical protein
MNPYALNDIGLTGFVVGLWAILMAYGVVSLIVSLFEKRRGR